MDKTQSDAALDRLLNIEDGLNEYQLKFVLDMEKKRKINPKWYLTLTPNQIQYLLDLSEKF